MAQGSDGKRHVFESVIGNDDVGNPVGDILDIRVTLNASARGCLTSHGVDFYPHFSGAL